MSKWKENFSEERNDFGMDYIFSRKIISFFSISIGERIRVVNYPYPTNQLTLVYDRMVGVNDKYMWQSDILSKIIILMYRIIGVIVTKQEIVLTEYEITNSKYMKYKFIESIASKHFTSYIRDKRLSELGIKH
jgi:hypothetical protein